MNRLDFLFSRYFRPASLDHLSSTQDNLLVELTGKSVAIVGNARALADSEFGAEIDAADLIIRINRAPMPNAVSHGCKANWLALATSLSDTELANLNPDRILWMSHKRKRLTWRDATSPNFYLHPVSDWSALKQTLTAPPTTGAMLIDLLAASKVKSVTLFGFDFFASQSLSGRRTADQVPHDFSTEKAWVTLLIATDPRFTLK